MSTTDTGRVIHRRPSRGVGIDTTKMRQAREAKELTRVQLGRLVGKTSAWVGQVEAGRSRPSPQMFPELARALGLSEAELRAS